MDIVIDHKEKIVEVWFSREDNTVDLLQKIDAEIANYHCQKYVVAIYRSGTANLIDNTKRLLLENVKTAAKNNKI
ncbi:MAG: hypothetical protein ACLTWR_10485 [Agathobaculum desmolans]|uniref:hypothetical protein n=1 Tax=Agathobaculum desmolans TaxID=39484 RepID=UPI0039943C98